jgi:hypothetical protein
MAKTTKTSAPLNAAGPAQTSVKVGQVASNALPLPQVQPSMAADNAPKVSKTDAQLLKEKEDEELLQDNLALEQAPLVAETDTLDDVLMAQATSTESATAAKPAEEDSSDRASAIPARDEVVAVRRRRVVVVALAQC